MDKLICQSLFIIGILLITGSCAYITQFPQNAAVGVGGTAVFNCSSKLLVQGWYLSRDGTVSTNSSQKITSYCDVQTGHSAHYKTEPSGGFQATCNLIVLNSTTQQAGVYVCSDGLTETQNSRALMTVVESMFITANQSDVVVGETLLVSCTIGHNGSVSPAPLLPPSISWTSSTGENISSYLTPSPPPNSIVAYILLNPDRSSNSIGPFICYVYFNEPQHVPGYATNAPSISSNTASKIFQVFYEPETKTNDFKDECLQSTFTLVCNVSANPPVNFIHWKELMTGVVIANASSVTISTNGTYQCVANNSIRNSPTEGSSNPIEINACQKVINAVVTGSNCTGNVCYCNNDGWNTLSCHAEGYPKPVYSWSNADD